MDKFNKPVAVMSVAITNTVTSSSAGLLSTKTTSNGPAVSDACMVARYLPFVSNETRAMDDKIIYQ